MNGSHTDRAIRRSTTGAVLYLVVFLVPLVLYLRTMPPTITWWFGGSDSGELVSAADALGVAHPTGYPLFVLLGHLASRVPAGEVAARINAMNALLGASGAAGIALSVGTLARGTVATRPLARGAAVVAALTVATSGLYWSQAIIGEVYILQAALVSLVLLVWACPGIHPGVRGAAHGFALTNHLTGAIMLAAALVAFARPRGPHRRRTAAWFGAGLMVSLSLYLLIPLRAAQEPIANWGDPDTPSQFLLHVTGWEYGRHLSRGDIPAAFADLAALLRLIIGDLPPWMWPAAAAGLVELAQLQRRYAVFTAISAAGTMLFTAAYAVADRAPYLLPVYVIAGVWCGVGLLAAGRWLFECRRRVVGAAVTSALLVSLGIWIARTGQRVDLSGDDSATVFARVTLEGLPPNATYYSARDDVTFALWYAQRSLGLRRDVRVVDIRNTNLRALP